jgi:DNA oxidative demethylase
MAALIRRPRAEVAPGAVHVPRWLTIEEQHALVAACREWACPPAGMRHTKMPTGGVMSVQTVCLGWHWQPYRYTRTAEDVDGAPVKPFPAWLADLGRRAVAEAYAAGAPETYPDADAAAYAQPPADAHAEANGSHPEAAAGSHPEAAAGSHPQAAAGSHPQAAARAYAEAAAYRPDVALINFYDENARMGMHADKDERSLAPVVSLSLGATCVFRFGNPHARGRPWHDVELESGDLFVFGGPSRLAYHGVPRTLPGTGPPGIGLPSGRLNITLRESGLT